METKTLKVVIAADNALIVNGLRHNLENKFRDDLIISGCYDARILLNKVHEHTDIVIIDPLFDGINSADLRKKISVIDHDTIVIIHSSHHDVIAQLDEIMAGNKNRETKKFTHKLAS
jgi:DNA-binding NtrC family response regulator